MNLPAHPCVVSLGVQQGDSEGGGQVGRVEDISEGQPALPQKSEQTHTLKRLVFGYSVRLFYTIDWLSASLY